MNTFILFNDGTENKFFITDDDRSHLDNVVIGSGEKPALESELETLLYVPGAGEFRVPSYRLLYWCKQMRWYKGNDLKVIECGCIQ